MEKKEFRILVADDDEIARDVISAILLEEGYTVLTARDGIEAIKLLRVENIHLVVTDLRMPGADGIEVLKYSVRNNPDVSVVILTAYGTLDTTLDAIKEGAYYYLTKPFKGQEIILVADRAFQKTLLVNENRELAKELRETYRSMDTLNRIVSTGEPELTLGWIERVERLRDLKVLNPSEAEILKERLVHGNGKGENINR